MNVVAQSIVLSNLEYCPVIWSSAAEKQPLRKKKKLPLVLHCSVHSDVRDMHKSWSAVEAKLKSVIRYNTPHFFCGKVVYAGFCHAYITCTKSTNKLYDEKCSL